MDIQSVKTLLELKFMQGINESSVEGSSDQFTQLLNSIMTSNPEAGEQIASTLGSHATLSALLDSNTSIETSTQSNSSINAYLSAFLLANQTVAPTNTIQSYATDYTSQTKYENFLEGAEKYSTTIAKAAATYNLPEKLLASVMKQESNFNANAVSSAGATGLMQLMPATAKYLGVQDATNPEQNIMGGAKYLRQMLNQFDNDVSLALAAYNAGPGNVKKYNGIPPFKETQNYVSKVMNYYNT